MTSKSCAIMYFAGKKRRVSMPKQLPPTPNSVSFSLWNCNIQPIYCLGRSNIGGKFIENPGYLAGLTMICGQNINPSCLAGLP